MIRIDVLGAPRCFVADRELAELPAQRIRFALLVYLAVERNVARDEASGLFWPDSSEERARHALSQSLYELKRILGDDWVMTQGGRLVIGPQLGIDAVRFTEHMKAGAVNDALKLYRGPFLSGFTLPNNEEFEKWLDRNRAQYERANRKARHDQVEALITNNRLAEAIEGARAWVDVDPLDDEAHHRLIELLGNAGDRAEALTIYAQYEQRLSEELNVTPLDHTRALVQRLRDADPTRVQPTPVRAAQSSRVVSDAVNAPDATPASLWAELKQRHVPRMAAWYVGTSLLVLQGGEALREALALPRLPLTVIAVLVVVGFPLTLVLSWYFEVTPEGRLVHDKRATPLRSEWRVFLTALGITTSAVLGGFIAPNVLGNRTTAMLCPDGSTAPCVGEVAIERNRFVVLPLIHAQGAEPHLLDGEMCARLLTDGLQHWRDINIVERTRVKEQLLALSEDVRSNLPIDTALAIARRLGAGKLIMGELSHRGDSTAVDAYLYDVVSKQQRLHRTTRFPTASAEAETVFRSLAQQFAISESGAKLSYSAGKATQSVAAMNALDSALHMLDTWQLKEAHAQLVSALKRDPVYPHAHLELAYVMLWENDTTDEWRMHADEAHKSRDRLNWRDQLRASGIAHLAHRRFTQACESYRDLVGRDRMSFFGWYGLGECLRRDASVVRNSSSASGWSFVTSWHEAIAAHDRALELVPTFNEAYFNLGSPQLEKVLFLTGGRYRPGLDATSDSLRFGAWPELVADTLALIPYPYQVFARQPPAPSGPAVVQRHRDRWNRAVERWAGVFPNNPRALEAASFTLEMRGRLLLDERGGNTAFAMIRLAGKYEDEPAAQLGLAATEVRILVKAGRYEDARKLAWRTVRAYRNPTPEQALVLAGLAGLLGRGHLLVQLLVAGADSTSYDRPLSGVSVDIPPPLSRATAGLLGYAYIGGPVDSVRLFRHRAHEALNALVAPERRALVHQTGLDRAARVSFPLIGEDEVHREPVSQMPFIPEQAALARGDTAFVRRRLNDLESQLQARPPTDYASDGVLTRAQLLLAIGDTTKAIAFLDRYLDDLHNLPRHHFRQPYQPATIVRLMIIRAEVAARRGDRAAARKWSRAVLELWHDADRELQPVLRRMRTFSRS